MTAAIAPSPSSNPKGPVSGGRRAIGGVRVLIVGGGAEFREMVGAAAGSRVNIRSEPRLIGCGPYIRQGAVDVVVVVLRDGDWPSVWEQKFLTAATRHCGVVLASTDPSSHRWLDATQRGFEGVLDLSATTSACTEVLSSIIARAMARRQLARRVAVLEASCRKLRREREQSEAEVGRLTASLAEQRAHCDTVVADASAVAEFRTLVSLEVELDATLRTGLTAFVLRTGAANAALLLPSESGSWRVAAYLKSTRTRAAVEGMLKTFGEDHAALVGAQQAVITVQPNTTTRHWNELHGTLFGWSALVTPCWAESKAEAVILCFRDGERAYEPADVRIAQLLASELGKTLERNRRVQSRAA